jgi:hypothetical protein
MSELEGPQLYCKERDTGFQQDSVCWLTLLCQIDRSIVDSI